MMMLRHLSAKAALLLRPAAAKPIFVLGTGRSGTHWVGHILESHPDIRITVEKAPMFRWSTQMALDPPCEAELLPKLIRAYKWQMLRSAPREYADKSHPNIWICEQLAAALPGARFLAVDRGPFATVASMLRHRGVSDWHNRWQEFPIPNRFLGITKDNVDGYEALSAATKCAMRWIAHKAQMQHLSKLLGQRMKMLVYESLIATPSSSVIDLQSFLGLARPIPEPKVKSESLNKWREQLSPVEVDDIAAVVGFRPEELRCETVS